MLGIPEVGRMTFIQITFNQQVLIELMRAVFTALFTFAVLFVIGTLTVAMWDRRKKYQEIDIEMYNQFQERQGEFYEVTKLWRAYYDKVYKDNKDEIDKDREEELLQRASAAESKVEIIINTLITDRVLCEKDPPTLGLYRQGYQQLRESIADPRKYPPKFGNYKDARYQFFEDLASRVAHIITERKRPEASWLRLHEIRSKRSEDARAHRRQVLGVRSRCWRRAVRKFVVRRYFEDILDGGNVELVDHIFDDVCALHDRDLSQELRGTNDVKEFVEKIHSAFSDIDHTIDKQVAKEHRDKASVSTRFTMRGTHKDGYQNSPPTGEKEVTMTGESDWHFAEDKSGDYKIKECWFYYDPPGLIKQLGVVGESEGQSSGKA
jgi:hypothetical protein